MCSYFRTNVRNFAGPLNFLTSKQADWRGGKLPPEVAKAFQNLKVALTTEPVMAYTRMDKTFHLNVDAAMEGPEISRGFGAILAQEDDTKKKRVVAFASKFPLKHEKNHPTHLAEMNAAAWAIDHFDVYLRGKKFIQYTDHKSL